MSALANIVLPLVTKQILMCLRFMSNIFIAQSQQQNLEEKLRNMFKANN